MPATDITVEEQRQVLDSMADCGSKIYSVNITGYLTIVGKTCTRKGEASSVATADGRAVVAGWHEGPETGEPVYYERIDRYGVTTAHGFVDSVSRQIVQTG